MYLGGKTPPIWTPTKPTNLSTQDLAPLNGQLRLIHTNRCPKVVLFACYSYRRQSSKCKPPGVRRTSTWWVLLTWFFWKLPCCFRVATNVVYSKASKTRILLKTTCIKSRQPENACAHFKGWFDWNCFVYYSPLIEPNQNRCNINIPLKTLMGKCPSTR